MMTAEQRGQAKKIVHIVLGRALKERTKHMAIYTQAFIKEIAHS